VKIETVPANVGQDALYCQLGAIGVLPVLGVEQTGRAVPLARCLAGGGLPAAELTSRTAAAPDVLREMAATGQALAREHVGPYFRW
jgi:2-keto-3-deoxy-6-phosphogluconate aldolase